MNTSLLEIVPAEIKQKIVRYFCDSDKVSLHFLSGYKNLVCNEVNCHQLDLDLFEDIPKELIEIFKEVALKLNYLTWQIGHVGHYRKLSQAVSRFASLVELDISGNPQIKHINFLVNLKELRAISFRCCFKLSLLSLLEVVPKLNKLTWLDVAHCCQLNQWHIEQLVRDSQTVKKLNVCGTVYFTLTQICKIEHCARH